MAAMCQEYCGTDKVEASADAMRIMGGYSPLVAKGRGTYWPTKARVEIGGADVVQAYDVDGEPVLPPRCAPPLADVPPEADFAERVTRTTGLRTYTNAQGAEVTVQRNNTPVLTGTPLAKLLRLSEELLECEFVDVDTQWYHKRLREIKAELAVADDGAATEA